MEILLIMPPVAAAWAAVETKMACYPQSGQALEPRAFPIARSDP
jgi:hypothetical protein